MKYLKVIVDVVLAVLCIYMLYDGLVLYFNTSGPVHGSEFGMLITLVSQTSLIMLWLALFALRSLIQSKLEPLG